jgi:hypothetical protein
MRFRNASQRFALAAGGRAGIRSKSRKNPKPKKCLKTVQNPTRQVQHLMMARPSFFLGETAA